MNLIGYEFQMIKLDLITNRMQCYPIRNASMHPGNRVCEEPIALLFARFMKLS